MAGRRPVYLATAAATAAVRGYRPIRSAATRTATAASASSHQGGSTVAGWAGRAGVAWKAPHQRVTFYCPDLLDQVEAEVRHCGRSKSRVITDALREHLVKP